MGLVQDQADGCIAMTLAIVLYKGSSGGGCIGWVSGVIETYLFCISNHTMSHIFVKTCDKTL